MDRNRWNTSMWLVCWIFVILCVLPTGSDPKDPFESQPKIIVQNGNILIKSAKDRNVTLNAVGLGAVQVNDIDLSASLPLVRTLVQQHAQSTETTRTRLSTLESQVVTLRDQFNTLNNLASHITQLEENVTAISNQIIEAFGGTSHTTLTNFRRVIRKVRRLDDSVRELTQLLSANECLSNPCRNGGTCTDTYNGFICQCTSTWGGVTCESDVNECAIYAGTSLGCQNGATCQNTPGSFNCLCAPNFYGFHCSQKQDDCSSASHEELCVHGTCIKDDNAIAGQPKYRCICEAGWTKGSYGPACSQDIDECASGTHRCSTNPPVLCINLPGTFHCGPCPAGFSGDGWTCHDINECLVHNGGCSLNPYVPCINTVGSRNCGPCPSGFVGDGVSCIFVGLCSTNNGGCHPLATCVQNTAISGSYRECRCPAGYVGNGEGLLGCTAAAAGSSCASNPCQNGNCQVVGNSFHCTCYPGYTGTVCDQQADPCLNNPCQNGGTCVRNQNTFTCICNDQFEGETCSVARQSCGGDVFQNEGNISFPRNPGEHYQHRLDCVWVITVSETKVLNFSFPRFHLEEGHPCEYDYVEIRDGPHATSPSMGRYCGDSVSQSFLSTHNQIYLIFKSDHSVSATGFTIKWNATDPLCGEQLPVSTHGAVNSPGYPGNYPQNRDCYWLVRVERGQRIQFQFATLQLEHHDNCSFDYLRIIDGASETDPELAKFCSTVTPGPVISSGANALLHFHSDHSVSDTGFHITYAAVAGIAGCGALLTSPSGTFTSPNFPDVYDHLLRCEWLIRIHPNDRIELSFSEFNVEYHSNCQFDYVAVYDGETDASNLIGRYCGGTDPPPKIMSNGNKLLIKFYTDYSVARGGFRASYTTVCGGSLTGLEGSFHSPYFPDVYPASATCYYQINLPPGHIIHLNIPFLDIERHRSCNYDFLEVKDGPGEDSASLGKFCGTTTPEPITSTYNQMWLQFTTDGSIQTHGFYANYTSSAIGCGGVMTNSTGYIGTPSHQTLYPPSITCTWLLRAPVGHIVRLTFETFALEHHTNCDFDYVLVQDSGGSRIGKYCGLNLPPTLISTNNEMQVTFVADSSVSHEGFNATYTFVDSSRVCGGDYYIESGVIKSPRYPRNYPHSKDCVWVLHAPNGRQFLLNVSKFELEQHEDCRYDYLEIRNGGYVTSPLIGRYCGETIPSSIPSHGNTMRLEFHSDVSMSAPGFEIFFDGTTTGCGGTVTAPRSHIISPNYPNPYGHNAECSWLIRVSEGSALSVTIVDLDIESHETCDNDFLQIYDGTSDSAPTVTRLCNGKQIPDTIRSTGNTLFIKFRTDVSDSGRGFHITYNSLCNNVLKKHRGVIESPNFPNTYPHNHNCSWTIEAPVGNNISLSFSFLVMENVTSCDADYVEVLQLPSNAPPSQLAKYCGTPFPLPLPIETTTNVALIRLVTDYSVAQEGFRLEYAVKGCGGDLQKNYGVISSPNYPHGYRSKVACHWHIKYPPGKRVKITISDLDLEAAEGCIYDYLRVYAGEDDTAPQLLNLCHKIASAMTVYSHGNHMFVKFYSDEIISSKGFRAYYSMENTGCGGLFTADHFTIMSPDYPSRYAANDDCQWVIRVDPTHIVELLFSDFELPSSTNCTSGYVAVYDGENTSMPLLMKHCGGMPENPTLYSTSNSMTIRLKADGNNVAKGFKAHYNTGCGQRILADNGGEITSPNYPHRSISLVNCSWILYASELTDRITLVITNLNFWETEDCEYSSLEIRDGDQADSPLIQKICGRHVPPHITSQGNTMHIFLHFHGVFRATYLASTSHCGGTFTSVSGSFASPEYPNNYPIDTECVWTIFASAGNKIMVSFSMFEMEDSNYCNMDYVEVREDNEGGPLIGRYCGNQIPNNITASNKMWVKFRSDDIGASPGFLGHYGLILDSELNGTSGTIESPEYPHHFIGYKTFHWTVTVPSHLYVSVSFERIEIPYTNDNQCYAGVKVYDGATDEAPELGKFCGYQVPDPVVSHGNQITIVFDGSGYMGSLWRLHWNAVQETSAVVEPESSCWNETYVNATDSVELVSPNYPNFYPYGYNCSWIIRAPPGNRIMLNFTDFYVSGYQGYCHYYDTVEIYTLSNPLVDSWTLNTSLCGRLETAMVESPNHFLKMTFISDYYQSTTGYNATARAICGGPLFGVSGMLNSSDYVPYFSGPNVFSFNCEWTITVRPRRTIRVSFDNFNIQSDNTCSGRYLLLLNGAHRTSPHLGNGKYCGSSVPAAMESTSNHVFIKLSLNSLRAVTPRFVLRYEELSAGCGGHVFINSSRDYYIQTPNYPQAPPHQMACDWIIMSPQGTRILVVDFYDGNDFRFTGDCYEGDNMEYVQLYDGGTELSEPLQRYCNHAQMYNSPMTTGNVLLIRFFSAVEHPEVGLKARIRTAECGGTISYNGAQVISPKYPENYDNGVECEWMIKLTSGYTYYLIFEDLETPPSSNCSQTDYVEIRSDDKNGELIGRYCGSLNNNASYISLPSPNTYIKFKANGRENGKGFSLSVNIDYSSRCGGVLQEPSGEVTSPNYPLGSSVAHHCYWRIVPPEWRIVTVTFTHFNLHKDEETGRCVNSLWFYISRHSRGLEFCGNQIPGPIDSSGIGLYIRFDNRGWAPGEGFSFTYTTEKESPCGGILPPPSGYIASPNVTFGSSNVIECKWRLQPPKRNQTSIFRFTSLDIPGNRSTYCTNGVVFFSGFIDSRSIHFGSYCGNMTTRLPTVVSSAEQTDIYFSSILETPFLGFNMSYNISDCGGVIDGYNATITSPGYPNNYTTNTVCQWILKVDYGDIITATITDLRMEDNCDRDYVKIAESIYSSATPVKFCGTRLPEPVTSSSFYMVVTFSTDGYGSAPGFRLTTTEVQRGCGGVIKRRTGYISSPKYPNRYPPNTECEWTIEYLAGSIVNLTFMGRFDIEMSANCENDYLMIEDYDEGRWISKGKFCGANRPSNMLSTSTKMRITFHSNSDIPADGFQIQYSTGCGGHFTEPEGIIRSLNYPDVYLNDLHCQYILGNPDHIVSLQFDEFDLEGHPDCKFDYVQFYRGNSTDAPVIGKYCGSDAPPPQSVYGQVLVEFVTDYSVTGHGFVLNYEAAECGGNRTGSYGVIRGSKRGYTIQDYVRCAWHIIVPENKAISLRIVEFPENGLNCYEDYLMVRDSNSTGRYIGYLCGNEAKSTVMKSYSNKMYVRYETWYSGMANFVAAYRSTLGPKQGCGGIKENSTGEFQSPDSDNDGKYDHELDCSWTIFGNSFNVINLTFTSFNLEGPRNGSCIYDYVEIKDGLYSGDPVIGRYCGSTVPPPIISSSNKITVLFHSDSKENKPGFRATFTSVPTLCGPSSISLRQNETVNLTSPGYPTSYPTNMWCRWRIYRYWQIDRLQIHFTDMDVPCSADNYVEIRNSLEVSNPYRICRNTSNVHDIMSRGEIWVTFRSGLSGSGRGFQLIVKDADCNLNFTKENGVILSPRYPYAYVTNYHCVVTVETTVGRTISLYFGRFLIQRRYSSSSEDECSSASLKVFEGAVNSTLKATLCGSALPNPIFSTGNKLTLELNTSYHVDTLYSISYTTTDKGRGCGGTLNNVNGTFTSPFYPEVYNQPSSCIWYLSVPSYHTMTFNFSFFELSSVAGCETNYLELYEGHSETSSNRIYRLCGDDNPGTYNSQSNLLMVKLVTNHTNTAPGFVAHFEMNSYINAQTPDVLTVRQATEEPYYWN